MLTTEIINKLKDDGFSFEEISELDKRIESIDNGTAVFLSEDEFWSGVNEDINTLIKKKEKCIK